MTGTRSKHTDALRLGNRIKVALVLLCVGLIGLGAVSLFMYRKAEAVSELSTYASRGMVNNVSDIFQIPALMFFFVLTLYAISELYKSYKALNDPETYRAQSAKRASVRVSRKAKRVTTKPAAKQAKRQITDQSKGSQTRQITDQSKDQSLGLSASQIPKPMSKPSKLGRTRRGRLR